MKRLTALATMLSLVLAACGGATTPPPASGAPVASLAQGCGPKGSGSLTILGTPQEEYIQGITKAFEAACGIKTSYVRLSSGEALAKLRADKASPQFSVWWGGPADGYIAANKEGLLEAYTPKGSDKIPAQYKDPSGIWTGIYVGALGVALNTKVLKDKNLPEPTSWADLAKPAYKSQISIAHPASSGTSYTFVATQAFLNNKDLTKTFDYLKQFHQNVLQYQKTGAAPARQAGQGEVAIGIVFSHDIVAAIEGGFKDLKIMFPSEGTGYEIGGMALLKGAPDAVAGKTFMDWAITVKAQEMGPEFKAYQLPTHPDAKVSEKSVKLSAVKTVAYDFQWAGDNKKMIVDRFSNEVAPQPR
jgi:iron(III) transport system substrate-binding protein